MQDTHWANEQLGAVVADASEDFDDCRDEANVEDRLGQLDVPKVPW